MRAAAVNAVRQAMVGLAAAVLVIGAARLAATPSEPRASDGVASFVPGTAGDVLERVTPGAARDTARLRDLAAGSATDPDLAVALARRHLDRARSQGESREAGRAQAALARWWDASEPPDEVLLLRAAIRQHQHDFDAAHADLARLTARRPDHRDAWWLRAALEQTTGRLDAARASCGRLAMLDDDGARLAAAVCTAELDSLQGERDAMPRLAQRLGARTGGGPQAAWVRLVFAEAAERDGRIDEARRAYEAALRDGATPYARVAYADFLLAQDRAQDAAAVLAAAPATDAVLVRRAIAARRVGDAAAATHAATLRDRFEAAQRRGDAPHAREQARLALDFDDDPAAALAHARRNWAAQKEPADLLLLARAAVAARDDATAAQVRAFVRDHRWADVRVDATGVMR